MPLKNDWANGDLFTPAAANDMADAVNSVVAVTVSRFLPGAASNQAAIATAITEAGVNGVVDFEGVSYVTTGTVTVSTAGVTLQNGGIRPTGQFTAMTVSAADVTVRNMTFSRSQSAGFTDSFTARCNVVVNGERFTSIDSDYLGSAAAQVYFSPATCNGSTIRGGRMTGAPTFQGSAGVWAAPDATGHQNLTIDGVHIYDMNYGVMLFNTGSSLVTNCRAESIRKIPTITLTGWTLVSGTTYRQRTASGNNPGVNGINTDRVEGNTNIVFNNGVYMGEVVQGSSTPTSGQVSVDGGYVYINLGGTNPDTRTITAGIVSGYAYMIYLQSADADIVSGNRFVDNYAEDIDGLGIYFQLGVSGGSYGNHATGNHLKDVCLEGTQHPSLPFAGIGITGGTDNLLANNTLDGVGSSGKTCPGIAVFQGNSNTDPSARLIGCTVRGSFGVGYYLRSSNLIASGCRADDNASYGFHVYETDTGAVIDGVTLSGCVAQNNAAQGFYVDGTTSTISNISVNIIGGAAIGNSNRGIQITGSGSTTTVTRCSVIGVLAKENGTSSQQIILSGAVDGITVAGCNMVHSGTSTGLYVAASVTNAVAFGNQFDISTPRTFLASVASGFEDSTTAALGVGTLNLGHASDTTLSRSAAGVLAVEGVNVLLNGGALGTPTSGTLTNCTFPTLNQNTTGTAAGLSATLVVGSGGTGVTSLTGLVKGNGSSAMSAATAGTDFVAPGGALGTPSSGTLTNCTGLPSSAISDSTSVGRSVLTAASASDARTAIGSGPSADVQVFLTPGGTWTKPAGALSVHVRLIGPGGGGGAGARGPSGTALSGGGGGGGGALSQMTFNAADLPATVSVNVPAGGAGAVGQTSDGTAGATGSASATSTTFSSFLVAQRAGGGVGGGLAVAGTGGGGGAGMFNGVIGAAGSATGGVGVNGGTGTASAGGGGGGGITTGGTANAGGTGGVCNATSLAAGTAGNGANGGAGASSTVKGAAPGGGGGGANASGAGYNGGNGGLYGAGGGGGGASLNGSTSGAGGNGGDGIAIVTTYF